MTKTIKTSPQKKSSMIARYNKKKALSHKDRTRLYKAGVLTTLFIALLSITFITLSACETIKQPKEVYSTPDYTLLDIKENEIKQIEKFSSNLPVKALWRAMILDDKETIDHYTDNLLNLTQKAIDDKDYFLANKYTKTLDLVITDEEKKKRLATIKASYKDNLSEYMSEIPGLVLDEYNKKLLPKSLSDAINATVTIWVDKGIKIEHGAGYADRVIGSGFFIDRHGYIVTNNHVINDLVDPKSERYSKLFIKLAGDNETRIPAKVVGYDKTLDLALLKATVDPPFILQLGSSADLTIGESVNAIGTPLGLHGTVTRGIVSAVDRKLFTTGSVLQIDAAVNSGNSGGPCIDKDFKVQAIVFAGIQSYQGLNFAIPVEYLRQDLGHLYSGGRRSHVWIGSFGHTAREGRDNRGLLVQYTMPGGVANRSSINKGDIITFIAEKRVETLEDAQDIFRDYANEMIIPITYLRGEESKTTFVYLEARPEQPGYEVYTHDLIATSFLPIFGMRMTNFSSGIYKKYVIDEIIAGSTADESGFSVGDIVTVLEVKFLGEGQFIAANLGTRRRKGGYIDIAVGIGTELDSPYYF